MFPPLRPIPKGVILALVGRDAAGGRVLEFNLELIIVMWPIRREDVH